MTKIRIASYIAGAVIAIAGPVTFASMMLSGNGQPVSATAAPLTLVSVGSEAPDFTLPTEDGRTMHLADYKGRAVFLVFVPDWTSADTVAQVKSLAKTENEFDMAGAKVMVVSSDSAENAKTLAAQKLPFPLLMDGDGSLARQFGVGAGMRRTYVVSPVGQVKYRVDSAVVDVRNHGKQLLDVSKCCVDEVEASRADGIGKPVGDYSLHQMNAPQSPMATIYGDGSQKVTAVLFLSAKCPCSNSYNERIAAMAKGFGGRSDVRLIGIYSNKDETEAEITAHAKEHGFTFPVFKDDNGLCATHFGASVTPEAFVIDSSRTLRYAGRIDDHREIEEVKTHEFTEAIDALIAGKEPPKATRAFGCGIIR